MKTKIKMYMIGNAHIDPAWLWRWQEGYAEIKATFRSALDRLNEFPDFVFTCSSAAYYKWVEENCPEMFEEIRQRVKEGRWVIVGGWWVQPDCNIPSGESFVRHSLYSQGYFMDRFNTAAKTAYNVDSFGHNAMLPQIIKKSGMDHYVFMRPTDHEKILPGSLFRWESEDGSSVIAYRIPFSYNNWFKGKEDAMGSKYDEIRDMAEKTGVDMMYFFGVGNHGGGPTITNLKVIDKLKKENERDTIIISDPDAYFEQMKTRTGDLPVIKDELQHHSRGCYSSNSEVKRNNRYAEHRLISAEKAMTLANALLGLEYRYDMMYEAWEQVMFNQFHDILGGCCIKEVYQDTRESMGRALNIGAELLNASVQKISWAVDTIKGKDAVRSKEKNWVLWEDGDKGTPLVVFNPLSWKVRKPLQVYNAMKGITDETGKPLPLQTVRASRVDGLDTLFVGDIPAMGYRTYWMYKDKSFEVEEGKVEAEGCRLENRFIRLSFDSGTGYIKEFFDKRSNIDMISNEGAVPVVIDEHGADTWAHGVIEFSDEIGRFCCEEIEVIENGPVCACIRVKSRYNESLLRQDFRLYEDKPEVFVTAELSWNEKLRMLKLSFPVAVSDPRAVYEIPYGHIERPVNGEEEPGQQWVDVYGTIAGRGEEKYGLALINDSKYSFSVKDNDLRMTVVRSPAYADHFGKKDAFCEYMDQGIHGFSYMLSSHSGTWKDAGLVKKAYEFNVQTIQVTETYHEGSLEQVFEGIKISSENVIASVFKKSEDGSAMILRCYEINGRDTTAVIEIPLLKRKWTAKFTKCEIKTFRIPVEGDMDVVEVDLLENQQ